MTIDINQASSGMSNGENRHRWNWREILAIIFLTIIIVLIGSFVLYKLYELASSSANSDYYFLINSALPAALEAAAILISVYLILPSVGLVAMMIQLVLGLPLGNPQLEFLLTDEISIPGVLIMLVFGGVIVPIAEEIFFRGLLYSWLRQTLKIWPAILISSALFGVLHGEISIAGATFLMGIILAWIYEKSTSLWPAISIHIINNSIKLLVLYLMIALGGDIPTLP